MKQAARNKAGGLYQYLDDIGVLKWGTSQDITAAKQNYWKEYRRNYLRNKRQQQKQFTISFTEKEYNIIQKASQKFKSCTEFIRHTSLSCAQGKNMVEPATMNTLIALFTLTYTKVQYLEEEHKLTPAQIADLKESLRNQDIALKEMMKKL